VRNLVIVTGASGFIGTHLCAALTEAGWTVRGVDRNDPPVRFPGEFVKADVTESPRLAALCADATHVVHLAALASVEASERDPQRAQRDTADTTRRMLQASANVKRFVLASTAAVYSSAAAIPQREDVDVGATSMYARAKIACEKMVREADFDAVCLRLFNVYGPGQQAGIIPRIVACASAGKRLSIQGDGKQTRDFLHVRDAARAFTQALSREQRFGGQPINIGSGEEISINSLVRLAVEVGGRPIAVDYTAARPGDLRRSCADVSRAGTELGFEASTSLAAGLEELLAAR
jgi:UDP-glucose 4-epimerase